MLFRHFTLFFLWIALIVNSSAEELSLSAGVCCNLATVIDSLEKRWAFTQRAGELKNSEATTFRMQKLSTARLSGSSEFGIGVPYQWTGRLQYEKGPWQTSAIAQLGPNDERTINFLGARNVLDNSGERRRAINRASGVMASINRLQYERMISIALSKVLEQSIRYDVANREKGVLKAYQDNLRRLDTIIALRVQKKMIPAKVHNDFRLQLLEVDMKFKRASYYADLLKNEMVELYGVDPLSFENIFIDSVISRMERSSYFSYDDEIDSMLYEYQSIEAKYSSLESPSGLFVGPSLKLTPGSFSYRNIGLSVVMSLNIPQHNFVPKKLPNLPRRSVHSSPASMDTMFLKDVQYSTLSNEMIDNSLKALMLSGAPDFNFLASLIRRKYEGSLADLQLSGSVRLSMIHRFIRLSQLQGSN